MRQPLDQLIPSDWYKVLAERGTIPQIEHICEKVEELRLREIVYPSEENMFRALRETPLEKVRVILIGQDPYINPGQAMGLAFSVPKETTPPPSLRNIFIELQNEFGGERRTNGDLTDWTAQGVLLLNSVLSVAAGQSFSHQHLGWQAVTRTIVEIALSTHTPKVMLLWGQKAKELVEGIPTQNNLVLMAAHPVAMTRNNPFIGCSHFLLTNRWLTREGLKPIQWV